MKVSDIIKNITEIQNEDWIRFMSEDELNQFVKYKWLAWNTIKRIKDGDVLLKIAEHQKSLENTFDNPPIWYSLIISIIPKGKYSYIYPKKTKKRNYDYDFLKLLADDLKENIKNCEDYYDILEVNGELEKYKVDLYSKYGIEYTSSSNTTEEKVEQRNIEELEPHPTNNEIYQKQFENTDKLEKSIKQNGQLEPIVITSKNVIISGHRRFKVLKKLGFKIVNVRVRDFDNEIEALINFNVQREKRGEDIENEIHYLEREVYSKMERRGRKKKGDNVGKVDKLTDYANRYEISRTSASTLLLIERNCPELIKRLKLKGNMDGDLTLNKAHELCFKSNQTKTQIKKDNELKKIKSILPRVDRKDLLELLKTTYPYSIMGSYSKLSKTTSFELNEDKFSRL